MPCARHTRDGRHGCSARQDTGFLRLTLRQHRTDNHKFTQITRTGWPLADISAARIITEWHGR